MLQAKNINYNKNTLVIVDAIDFECNPGELIGILGPNGAGKSSFLSILANEFLQKGNHIIFKNNEYKKWNSKELPKHKAKFSQNNNTDIPLKVFDVIMMGRYPYFDNNPSQDDEDAVLYSMRKTDTELLSNIEYNHLSGGEKQRIHLARVIAQLENDNSNKILFLDEPLNNLDVLHQHNFLQYIKDFTSKGNTALVVLHDLNLAAQFTDKILLMKKGKKVCFDSPEKVLTQEIISDVYNYPCTLTTNPITNHPLIIFG